MMITSLANLDTSNGQCITRLPYMMKHRLEIITREERHNTCDLLNISDGRPLNIGHHSKDSMIDAIICRVSTAKPHALDIKS